MVIFFICFFNVFVKKKAAFFPDASIVGFRRKNYNKLVTLVFLKFCHTISFVIRILAIPPTGLPVGGIAPFKYIPVRRFS